MAGKTNNIKKTMTQTLLKKIRRSFSFAMYFLLPLGGCWVGATSCSDLLDTESELVEYEKDNTLDHPSDSLYSIMGIVNKIQIIADRTVLLGEARSDLMQTTDAASSDLKRLAAFDFSVKNKYNQVSDYYAVINNCNYFLAHADTAMQRRGRKLFTSEYAAVKGFRAWAYLELAKVYGNVPLVTEPVVTERQAAEAAAGELKSLKDICDYFIDDLTPYATTIMPSYGQVGGFSSSDFFIPTRALLGDLCLWAGRYSEAAKWYSDYLNDKTNPVYISTGNKVRWTSSTVFNRPLGNLNVYNSTEVLSYIPMETTIYEGTTSDLDNVMESTRDNYYYYQMEPSRAMRKISSDQVYCMTERTTTSVDTIYVPRTGFSNDLYVGDLRLSSVYSYQSLGDQDPYSDYSMKYQSLSKIVDSYVITYRSPMVYLRFAEALNRCGYPQSAMLILKYGLCDDNVKLYVDSKEYAEAKQYIDFDKTNFTKTDVCGIHSRGSGDTECDTLYVLPKPNIAMSRQDSIEYQIPRVEQMIIDEMALEGAFEGYRYYDLMRIALRRNDPSYLADRVSSRNGTTDETLRQRLLDTANWYLPLR